MTVLIKLEPASKTQTDAVHFAIVFRGICPSSGLASTLRERTRGDVMPNSSSIIQLIDLIIIIAPSDYASTALQEKHDQLP